jgi:hypothetical protein
MSMRVPKNYALHMVTMSSYAKFSQSRLLEFTYSQAALLSLIQYS